MNQQQNRQKSILIVDDETIVQSLVHDAMEDEGYHVSIAGSGSEALTILAERQIDLLITDIRMPGMTGIELVKRAREFCPSIGVIFITGYANLNSAKDAIKQGALDYVMKPFDLNEIRTAVHNAFNKLEENASNSGDEKLESLSDLSDMLFTAGDRSGLVQSSLKFVMLHLHAESGSILYWSSEHDQFAIYSIWPDKTEDKLLGSEPLLSLTKNHDISSFAQPSLLPTINDFSICKLDQSEETLRFFSPPWQMPNESFIVAPLIRNGAFLGSLILKADEDTVKVRQVDLKFLALTASQLALSLENQSLLEETRGAYASLKKLQDETIELEKMATRGEMSAEIGHELNNFLGVIAGNVELIGMHINNEKYEKLEKCLGSVTRTINKMTDFTKNLMDLGTISSKREITYFEKIISEVVEYLKFQKRFKAIDISIDSVLESIPFLADTTQIQQVLYNLFNNSADATVKTKNPTISISINIEHDLDMFSISIKDNGTGFNTENLKRAFREKFTTKKTGHGFGLVVCKRIIDNHEGRLEIESTPSEGTQITIWFPLQKETVDEMAPTL